MGEEKTGLEKARETAAKIKAESTQSEEVQKINKEIALSELQEIAQNAPLAKLYRENARIGSANLGGTSPTMKVSFLGKSKHRLADGGVPHDGWFFYSPTQKEFETLDVHILSVSRGFRTKATEKDKKDPFTQLIAGICIDGTMPFIMYLSGGRLAPMWEFGKEANKYTHNTELPIPLFALSVHLTTRFEKNADPTKSDAWLIDFTIMKSDDGFPQIITDQQEFEFLREKVYETEANIESLIEKIEVKENTSGERVTTDEVPY